MTIHKFKTNAKCGGCAAAIGTALEKNGVATGAWSLDLTGPDKVLTVESDLTAADIVRIVTEAGFRAELLER